MSTHESRQQEVLIDVAAGTQVRGQLSLPPVALGVAVMLCDGGPRADAERSIAATLVRDGCATLCLQPSSEPAPQASGARPTRGDVELLATRLVGVTEWLSQNPDMQPMNIGYFASGASSAAAFLSAARAPDYIDAIVAVFGRPDLAGEELEHVRAATLLITGDHGANHELNRKALERVRADKALTAVPSGTLLYEDPGALAQVAELASKWFVRHLMSRSHSIPA